MSDNLPLFTGGSFTVPSFPNTFNCALTILLIGAFLCAIMLLVLSCLRRIGISGVRE